MILYKPLEDVLVDLEKQAKSGDKKGSQRHYQTRYNQLKFILRGQKDFGQLHEGSD